MWLRKNMMKKIHMNVQVPETEGEWAVEGPELESSTYTQPIKTWKVNIGMTENMKFA
jgi:hypothetical protein